MLEEHQVRQLVSVEVARRGKGGLTAFAEEVGLKPSSVSDFLTERRKPPAKLLDALNLRKVVRYENGAAS